MSRPRILDEDRLTLEEAREHFGTNGTPADFTTVYRAVVKGSALPDGGSLRLEAVRLAGRWITSKQAIESLCCHLDRGMVRPRRASEAIATRRERKQHSEATERRLAEVDVQLAALGI